MTISTDIIVGFPGETKEDFNKTLEAVKEINPEILNRSNFGPRPLTKAAKLKQISPEIMKKRSTELMKLHLQMCKENQKSWINKQANVFVDKKGFNNTYLARSREYKLFAIQSKKNILGKFVNVKVKKVLPHYLISEPLI
jgi:tRNA-2-methylthio-N6-dimethylallyladenosine synthase